MNESLRKRDGSTVYAQIEATPMGEADRRNALAALEMAEILVDTVARAWKWVADLASHLLLKPGVKH